MNLFDYQKKGVEFVGANKKVYLAFDMGMGKTLTAVAAGATYARKNILVIAELNEIENSQNFRKEVETHFAGELQYHSLRDKETPPLAHYEPRYVCGINPDALGKLDIEFLKQCFDFVIVDEATMAKTTTTARFKAIKHVCDAMEYVVFLSGTPMLNGAAELYGPLLLLGHKLVGNGTAKAKKEFETVFAGGQQKQIRRLPEGKTYRDLYLNGTHWKYFTWWAKGANNVRELRYLIQDRFFFMRKADSSIFKKKVRTIEWVPVSMEWLAEYQQAWAAYLVEAGKRGVDMDNVTELQALIEKGQTYQVNSKWKGRRAVADIAAGKYGDRRIVLFTLYQETYDEAEKSLAAAGVSYKTFDDIKDFKNSDARVLLGRIKAHGRGGNVPEASAAIFVDMDFVPAYNLQAENRIDRPEQTRDMIVVYYMAEGADMVDAHVRNINQDKNVRIDEFMRPFDEAELAAMPAAIAALREKYGNLSIPL